MTLKVLETKLNNLNKMRDDLTAEAEKVNSQVRDSFTNKNVDSDALVNRSSNIESKLVQLGIEISVAGKDIADEENRIIQQAKFERLAVRQDHIKLSIEALARSEKLMNKLSEELFKVTEHFNLAETGSGNREIMDSVRGVIGRLAFDHKQQGALMMANTIPIVQPDRLEVMQSHLAA